MHLLKFYTIKNDLIIYIQSGEEMKTSHILTHIYRFHDKFERKKFVDSFKQNSSLIENCIAYSGLYGIYLNVELLDKLMLSLAALPEEKRERKIIFYNVSKKYLVSSVDLIKRFYRRFKKLRIEQAGSKHRMSAKNARISILIDNISNFFFLYFFLYFFLL